MSDDFDSQFDAAFGRSLGSSKDFVWKAAPSVAAGSATTAMDRIEEKIKEMESHAEAMYELSSDKAAETIARNELKGQVDAELANLKKRVAELRNSAGLESATTNSETRLVVAPEPKKMLPALRAKGLNLPKRLKD